MTHVLPFTEIDLSDLEEVGGKNASLGELIRNLGAAGVQVPGDLWQLRHPPGEVEVVGRHTGGVQEGISATSPAKVNSQTRAQVSK